MNVARTAAEVLDEHTVFKLDCVDRMYLNAYVPVLQTTGGAAWFFRKVRGKPVPSSALMAPMSRNFVAGVERFAEACGVDLVAFERERAEAGASARLRRRGGCAVRREGAGDDPGALLGAAGIRGERPFHVHLMHATAMVNRYCF